MLETRPFAGGFLNFAALHALESSKSLIRAYLYLAVSGIIWMVEGFLFSYYLGFTVWQTVLIGLIYASLFALVVGRLMRSLRASRPTVKRLSVVPRAGVHQGGLWNAWDLSEPADDSDQLSAWRVVSLAPMLVVVVGSFASLPLVILVAALGKI